MALLCDEWDGRAAPDKAEANVRRPMNPSAGLTGILLTQRMMTSPEPTELVTDFWAAAYAAIDT